MRRMVAVLALSAAATVVMTWPVARQLADHVVVPRVFIGRGAVATSPDTYLHLWILAWVHHALTTEPTRLFDANIMYPAEDALGGSEHMLAYWPLHAPVYAASRNPVLGYQWVLFSSFILNATALFVLVQRWTRSPPAAAVAAFLYAFLPLRFDLLGTVQHLNTAYLPLLVLFADRYAADGRVADLAGVAVATALQALCSYYLAYATAVAVGVVCAAVALAGADGARRRAVALGAAGALGFLPLAMVSGAYLRLRGAAIVPEYPDIWLRAASARPAWFVRRDLPLFTGYVPLALALAGALVAQTERRRRWLALGLLVVGFVLALGPVVTVAGRDIPLPYRALYAWVPGFSSLRYPYRFGTLSALGLALLAGLGWSRAIANRALAWPLSAVALAVIGLEFWQAPLELVRVEVGRAVPPAYRWLDEHGAGRPMLEWPIPPPGDLHAGYEHARAMYFSTYHWLPLLNGYTAYEPPSLGVVLLLAQRLPDARSMQDLIDLTGVRLLLLHRDRLDRQSGERWAAWLEAANGCERLAEFGPDIVCGLASAREDLRARLIAANERAPAESFRGFALAPLRASDAMGRLVPRWEASSMPAGVVLRLRLEATNRGQEPWPGLAPLVAGTVSVRHRWRPAGSGSAEPAWIRTPLLCDLAPGESCTVVLPVTTPREAGGYMLELGLGQEGGAEIDLDGGPELEMPVQVVPFGRARPSGDAASSDAGGVELRLTTAQRVAR